MNASLIVEGSVRRVIIITSAFLTLAWPRFQFGSLRRPIEADQITIKLHIPMHE
jgi:hypothetical protein